MKEKAIGILDENRLMGVATLRPDGWPHATMVSYANEDILIYFVVSRQSQKFRNMQRDDRVSIVIGGDFHDPSTIKARSIAARATEVRDPKQFGERVMRVPEFVRALAKFAPQRTLPTVGKHPKLLLAPSDQG